MAGLSAPDPSEMLLLCGQVFMILGVSSIDFGLFSASIKAELVHSHVAP